MSSVASLQAARLNTVIGPYRVLDVLGEGGMGVVYRAEELSTGAQVALKTVREAKPSELRGIRGEILTLSRVQHPMVVRLLAQGMHEGVPWYAMELLEGKTLAARSTELWIHRRASAEAATSTMEPVEGTSEAQAEEDSTLPSKLSASVLPPAAGGNLPEVLRLFRQLCEPLAFLHGLGLVHRDLKPSNVFLREDGTLTLMDFGTVARFLGSNNRESLEVGGLVVGSAAYMAPEQVRGDVGDARADLYSLGCMLYEIVAGQRPFNATTVADLFRHHLSSEAVPLSQRVAGVPPQLDQLVRTLMSKQPRQRLGYVDDVAAVLESLGAPRPARVGGPYGSYLYRPELTGRQELLNRLVGHAERARQGHGAMVLLGGESGVGKTFLAARVSQEATRHHARVVTGECLPISVVQGAEGSSSEVKGAPLHPFRTFLQALADQSRQRGAEWTEAVLGRRGKVLAMYEPSLRGLPGQDAYPEPPELTAEAAHRRLMEDLTATLLAFVARDGALLLVLDDLQWADELSLDFLGTLASGALNHGLIVLGTYRSDEVGPRLRELLAKPGVTNETVPRLDEQAVGTVVSDMLALPHPPDAFVHFLARQSEGNPFFVAEYLRTAVAERVLVREVGTWRFAEQDMDHLRFEALPLPDSVRELVVRRLSGLEPGAWALVEMASVLGREGRGSLLQQAAQVSDDEALALLKELVARQIFEPPREDRYRFVHDKLREHAYQRIAPERRKALHHSAALVLEQAATGSTDRFQQYSALAHHFQQAEAWNKAREYTEKSGELALASFSNHEAITLFERLFELSARVPVDVGPVRKAAWERSLVEAHLGLGHMAEAAEHVERTLRHCGQSWPTTKAGWGRGLAQELVQCALPVPRTLVAPRTEQQRALLKEAAYVYNRVLEPMFVANRALEGMYCGVRSLNLAERLEPTPALARSLAFMCHLLGITPLKKAAHRWSRRSLVIAETLGHELTLIYCLVRSATFHFSEGEWAEAEARTQRAADIAQRLGDDRQREEAISVLQAALTAQGHFEKAVSSGQPGLESGQKRGDLQILSWLRPITAMSLSRLGKTREALELLEANRPYLDTRGGDADRVWTNGIWSLAHLEAGELAQARQRADAMLAIIRKSPPINYFMATGVVGAAETYLSLWESGREGGAAHAAAASDVCAMLEKHTKMYPYAGPVALNRRGEHAWLAGQATKALECWHEALRRAEQLNMPYERARAHARLGRHLPGTERRNHLERALALFEQYGAKPDVERTRRILEGGG